ncbi:MAG: hypothetical protein CVV33_05015, partial [Methanomicrobiales archaeon HGW-Methanomicrobiales-4]
NDADIIPKMMRLSMIHDWLGSDGKETFFFDVPSELRKPGLHTLIFRIFAPISADADAKQGEKIYESQAFSLEYTA